LKYIWYWEITKCTIHFWNWKCIISGICSIFEHVIWYNMIWDSLRSLWKAWTVPRQVIQV